MNRRNNSRFQRGTAVYVCRICDRRTRFTGGDGAGVQLCDHCFELAGIDNYFRDGGQDPDADASYLRTARAELKACQDKGGKITAADFDAIPF